VTAIDPPGDAFRRELEIASRRPQSNPDGECVAVKSPGLVSRLDFGPSRGGGGEARWGLAMEWADEPQPGASLARTPALDSAPSADVEEAVARELGLGACLTADALAERWRAFVWRNHPDRQPAHARERANSRVAVANALYDSARRALRRA
jgi:hypothetical protein